MDWRHETYRKLYVRVDAQWLSLSILARGIGDELLKYVDDLGSIPLRDETPGDRIARLLGATERERKPVRDAVKELLDDGYLEVDTNLGALVVRNFMAAQAGISEDNDAKSPSARRAAAYRARKRVPAGNGHTYTSAGVTDGVTESVTRHARERVTRDVTEGVTKDVTKGVTGTLSGSVTDGVTPRTGAGERARPCLPSVPSEEEEKSASANGDGDPKAETPRSAREEILELLEASPEILEAAEAGVLDVAKMANGLLGDAMNGGWKDRRIVACLPLALRALSMAGDPSKGPQAYVRNMVCRIARPGVLEAEQAKFNRAPKPQRDRDDELPREPEWFE